MSIMTNAENVLSARREAIEECALLLDRGAQELSRQRDPGMANHLRAWAKRLRALKSD